MELSAASASKGKVPRTGPPRARTVLVHRGAVPAFVIRSWTYALLATSFLLGTGQPGLTQQRQAGSYLWSQVFAEERGGVRGWRTNGEVCSKEGGFREE